MRDVQTFVALQPNQIGAQPGRQHLCDLGLADTPPHLRAAVDAQVSTPSRRPWRVPDRPHSDAAGVTPAGHRSWRVSLGRLTELQTRDDTPLDPFRRRADSLAGRSAARPPSDTRPKQRCRQGNHHPGRRRPPWDAATMVSAESARPTRAPPTPAPPSLALARGPRERLPPRSSYRP